MHLAKPTINLSILETHLQECRSFCHFLQLHARMVVSGYIHDTYAASRVLDFSTRSPFVDVDYSVRLLHHVHNPNEFTWNRVMKASVNRNRPHLAFHLYNSKLLDGSLPDNYTYPILLQACSVREDEREGEQIHTHVLEFGFRSDVYVVNTLMNLYCVCGKVEDARQLFDESPLLDVVSWNTILAGYVDVGDVKEATWVYDRMPERSTVASNSMIAMLGRRHLVDDARRLFDRMSTKDVVSWAAIISCYEQNGMYSEALKMFTQMISREVLVDEVVLISVLTACARLVAAREGELIHGLAVRTGFVCYINLYNSLIYMYSSCGAITVARRLFDEADHLDQISWNSMISGYLKCGFINDARQLFDAMTEKDAVSWSTMLSGYAQYDRYPEALALFHEMQLGSVMPDETALVSVLSGCAHLSSLEQGRWIHAYIRKNRYRINVILGTTLMDMYMKCGCMTSAMGVFNTMEQRSVSTWNALIMGLAMNGLVTESLEKFSEMKSFSVVPNEITFVGVLGACRHVGLVDEGRLHFDSMKQVYKIEPNVKHYGCMVDLLGRAGFLKEAEDLIESMPMAPDIATWGALLGACRKHGEFEIGERVGRKLIELEPQHDGFHVLLSNIYASRGKWNDAVEIRGIMKEQRILKVPGCSLIQADGVVHEFLAGDVTHPQTKEIKDMMNEITVRLKMEGYVPDTRVVTLNIDEEEKETSLYRHSEKLAIAFGLISTSPPTPIRIMKNLRICSDCHSAAKIISRVFHREIIVRDRQRFHHFADGVCSCADYW